MSWAGEGAPGSKGHGWGDAGSWGGKLVLKAGAATPRVFWTRRPLFCLRAGLTLPPSQVCRKSGPTSQRRDCRSPVQGWKSQSCRRTCPRPGFNPSVPEELVAGVGPLSNVFLSPNLQFFSCQMAGLRRRKGGACVISGGGLSRQLTSLARKLEPEWWEAALDPWLLLVLVSLQD